MQIYELFRNFANQIRFFEDYKKIYMKIRGEKRQWLCHRQRAKGVLSYIFFYLFITSAISLFTGCSATRDLGDDELMLDKVKVVADGKYKDISTSQLKSYVR